MPRTVPWAGGAWLLLLAAYAWAHRLWRLLFWSTPVGATVLIVPFAAAATRDEFHDHASDFVFLIIAPLMIVAILTAVGAASVAAWRRIRLSPLARNSQPMRSTARWACGAWVLVLTVYAWLDGGSLEDSSGPVTVLAIASLVLTVAWGALLTMHKLWLALLWSTPVGATVLTIVVTVSFTRDESGVESFYPQWIFVVSFAEVAGLTAAGAGLVAPWSLLRARHRAQTSTSLEGGAHPGEQA
jgi:hypothetical protein